jgi:Tfp pilus assembly protein PilO
MGANKAMPWVVGTVLAIVAILAGGWLLVISPAMAGADDSRAQAAASRDHNDQLRRQVATLKEQFTHLDQYNAQLAALQVQLPQNADLSALNTALQSTATAAGVTTTALSATPPQAFLPVGNAVVPSSTSTSAASVTTDAAGSSAKQSASKPSFAGFYAIPVSITTVGGYDATLAFLDSLQNSSTRLFLVGTISATSQPAAGAASGKPATSAGDLETTITGFAYVLQDAAAVTAPTPAPTAGATPTPLPAPAGQKNPFIPVS